MSKDDKLAALALAFGAVAALGYWYCRRLNKAGAGASVGLNLSGVPQVQPANFSYPASFPVPGL
ncbi:MAG: hypothetical protein ACRETA_09730 [Gammaproteobacteria bacterium]